MSDQKRILTKQHKGWQRVWDLITAMYPPNQSVEYTHTVNDTHVFKHKDVSAFLGHRWVYATVHDGDFEVVNEDTPVPPPTMVEEIIQELEEKPQEAPFDFDAYNGIKR